MKIIALYLPQFHEIPENNAWWGKGFTEWVNVRKARPLFEGHEQPYVPLGKNYYDLLELETLKWQFKIAKENGVYGFSFYHYWFNGKLLLEKPLELVLQNPDLDLKFTVCWANENWTNSWVSSNEKILMSQEYGDELQWEIHFNYLLNFFKDPRYIKENNKPFLTIYRPDIIECLNPMLDYWNQLAVKHGFSGLTYAYQHVSFNLVNEKDDSRFSYNIEYQPMYYFSKDRSEFLKLVLKFKKFVNRLWRNNDNGLSSLSVKVRIKNYDKAWNYINTMKPESEKSIPGAFVRWDNTPRKGNKGLVIHGSTPEKFEKYMMRQIENARVHYKKDYIFIFAWNEWAEGGFLEPDQKYEYRYLEALKNALISTNEFPDYENS